MLKKIIENISSELKELYSASESDTIALILLEEISGLSRVQLLTRKEVSLNDLQKLKLQEYIERLKKYEPIQYVLGETEFFSLRFKVNNSVLIPRPETEELVEWILEDRDNLQVFSLLDIGTGSGCIPISIKYNRGNAQVYALDYSVDALKVAEQNMNENQVDIRLIHDDILNPAKQYSKFDVIVSNPPYIPVSEAAIMDKNVIAYEPNLALFVENDDPLLFYKKIADFAILQLKENGVLYFETHFLYAKEVKTMLLNKGFKEVWLRKDISGNERMIKALL